MNPLPEFYALVEQLQKDSQKVDDFDVVSTVAESAAKFQALVNAQTLSALALTKYVSMFDHDIETNLLFGVCTDEFK